MMKRIFIAFVLAVGFLPVAHMSQASAASLGGTWTGRGTIYPVDGHAEKAKCRITYSKVGESSYNVKAKCSSTSGKAVQTATVRPTGKDKYSGSFFNKKHNASGSFNITLKGNRQTVSMSSSVARATISLSRK